MSKPRVEKVLEGRTTEQMILTQFEHSTTQDSFRDWKDRIEDFKRVYRGDWAVKYADGSAKKVKPLIENLAKNAIHDISGLANAAKSSVKFTAEKEDQPGVDEANVREAIADTLWEYSKARSLERKLYMDLIGSGAAILALTYDKRAKYARAVRLAPEFCYPDVRNGFVEDLLFIERIKLRTAQRMFKDMVPEPWRSDEVSLVEYYDDTEVVRALIHPTKDKDGKITNEIQVVERWVHKLRCIPVAFVQLDTYDGAMRGLLDQVEGPLAFRNTIMQYMEDYLESMVHAPFEERGVENATDLPGPTTIYHHDETIDGTFMRRVAPAAPPGQVFNLIAYSEAQASGEAIQPPARQGSVSQSIASGSFVQSTLGRLTTVIEELQDLAADLRQQATYVLMEIEEKWTPDDRKPLIRPVGKKNWYVPARDIGDEPLYCTVQYGAMGGLSKQEADVRVLQHLGARLVSRARAREQIDYLDDPTWEKNQIDQESLEDSFLQRIATDPTVPPNIVAQVILSMGDGMTLYDAIKGVAPQLVTVAQPSEAQPTAPQPGAEPGAEQAALAAGATGTGGPGLKPGAPTAFQPPPLQQQIVRNT